LYIQEITKHIEMLRQIMLSAPKFNSLTWSNQKASEAAMAA
jgi:hypothetical protein